MSAGGGAHDHAARENPTGTSRGPVRRLTPAGPGSPLPGHGLLHLQRGAGNRAVVSYLQRHSSTGPVAQRAPDKGVVSSMKAAETALDGLSASALGNVATVAGVSDAATKDLKEANKHLTTSNRNYKAGHKLFTDVLADADKSYEIDKAIEDAVQGVLVAAALAVVAPEAVLTAVLLEKAALSASTRMTALGLRAAKNLQAPLSAARAAEGGVGEVIEIGAGTVVGATITDAGRPSDTVAGAGPSPGERFEQAFLQLGAMIASLPRLGKLTVAEATLSSGALELAREAVKVRLGDEAQWTAAEITAKTASLKKELSTLAAHIVTAQALATRVATLKGQVLAKPIQEPVPIEDNLWLTWMASLEGPAHEVLDNRVLLRYLGPSGKKLIGDTGWWTSDAETQKAAADARLQWLRANGIQPGKYPDTQYRTEMKLREVRPNLTGKAGLLATNRQVLVAGRRFGYRGIGGPFPSGTPVIARGFHARGYYLDGSASVAVVRDGDLIAALEVDRSRLRVRVPHVVGLPEIQALDRVRMADLKANVVKQNGRGVSPGFALGIDPAPGTELAANSPVTLVIAR